jgi:hypothetical protein
MIIPTKIIRPSDSLINIGSEVLTTLKSGNSSIDTLFEKLNDTYIQKISFEKFLLCLNFLYIIDKVVIEDEIIKIRIR